MRTYLLFELKILLEALRETRRFIVSNVVTELLFTAALALAASIFSLNYEGFPHAILVALVAIALVFAAVFVWQVAAAPYRLWNRQGSEIAALRTEIEARGLPGISIRFSWSVTPDELMAERDSYICDLKPNALAPCVIHAARAWEKYYADRANKIGKAVITNHSESPLFNVKLPVRIEYYAPGVEDKDGNRGPADVVSEISLPLSEKVLKAGEEAVLFFNNESAFFVEIYFQGYVTAEMLHAGKETNVPLQFENVPRFVVCWPNSSNLFRWMSEKRASAELPSVNSDLLPPVSTDAPSS